MHMEGFSLAACGMFLMIDWSIFAMDEGANKTAHHYRSSSHNYLQFARLLQASISRAHCYAVVSLIYLVFSEFSIR